MELLVKGIFSTLIYSLAYRGCFLKALPLSTRRWQQPAHAQTPTSSGISHVVAAYPCFFFACIIRAPPRAQRALKGAEVRLFLLLNKLFLLWISVGDANENTWKHPSANYNYNNPQQTKAWPLLLCALSSCSLFPWRVTHSLIDRHIVPRCIPYYFLRVIVQYLRQVTAGRIG